MGRGPCSFKEADLKKAVKVVVAAGQSVRGVRFNKDGGFTVLTGPTKDTNTEMTNETTNEWDEKYGKL